MKISRAGSNTRPQLILVSAFLLLLVFSSKLSATEILAFNYVSTTGKHDVSSDLKQAKQKNNQGIDSWRISLNPELAKLRSGQFLTMLTPIGEPLNIDVRSRHELPNQDIQLFGEFGNDGSVVFTLGVESYFASVNSSRISYAISGEFTDVLNAGTLIDNASLPEDSIDLDDDMRWPAENPIEPDKMEKRGDNSLTPSSPKNGEPTKIGVLVVYSDEFKQIFNQPITRINQLIGFSNAAFASSDILIELELVRAKQLSFNNAANLGTSLDQATDGIGAFSGLHDLRERVGGDLVVILHGSTNSSASGVAWVSGDRAPLAYSATRISIRCCDSVFTHEIGHNLGSGHERLSSNPNQTSPCRDVFTNFACGYGNSENNWGTIMSYLSSGAIGHRFSNPDQLCLGEPCGIPVGSPNAADNRAAFNISRQTVAGFTTPTGIPFLPSILELLESE